MKKNIKSIFIMTLALGIFSSCQEDLDSNEVLPYEQIGGYNNSDEIATSNLLVKCSFEDNVTDSKSGITGGVGTNVSYSSGVKGNAYQGSASTFITYSTVSTTIVDLKNITVSMWIKTNPHTGGAQSLFMLPKTTDFWGNIFSLIEGTTTDKMQLKNHIQKDVTPSIPWSGQFIDHAPSNLLSGMYGSWRHLVWSYNASTSSYNVYVDGQKISITEGLSKRYTNDPLAGGLPFGDLANSNVSKFIIGGYQQHLGAPWGAPDGWMLNYTGLMDEFRMYNSALTDNEVNALYKLEKDNR